MIDMVNYELHYKLKFYDGSEIEDIQEIKAAINEKSLKEKVLMELLINNIKEKEVIFTYVNDKDDSIAIMKKYDDVKEIVLTDIKTKKHNPFEAELRNEP